MAQAAAGGGGGGNGLGQSSFTAGQLTFIERLAGDTGLDPGVIAAWCFAEENGSAATSRESAGNHNWLNIGYFDSGAGAIAFNAAFKDPTSGADQTAKFLKGTWGGAAASIRAILNTVSKSPSEQIGAIRNSHWASSGYPSLPSIYGSLDPKFKSQIAAATSTGGAAGLGGTGTTPNKTPTGNAPFQVGDTSNPDEDYFTAINRLSQGAYWYTFSDGETLYVADGTLLMQQTPARVINRFGGDVLRMDMTWDNTAFQYASHHRKRGRVQRKATLAKVASPVEATVELICPIDAVRGGDVVYLLGTGPGDGLWLVGDCTRSVFNIYSELTLVPALAPVNAVAGVGTPKSGPAASKPGAGTVIAAMISRASTISNRDYPYVWAGGHAQAGTPSIGSPGPGYDGHTIGYDCSGAVGAVAAAGGLIPSGASIGSDASLVAQLRSSGFLVAGQGTGSPECTIFDKPGVHVYMRLNGQHWGTSDGENGNHSQPHGGAGWLNDSHLDDATFTAWHVPQKVLGQPVP